MTAHHTWAPRCDQRCWLRLNFDLDQLSVHTEHHFEQENRLMNESEFPSRGCHIDEHNAVLASVREVRELLAQGNTDVCRRLVNELSEWFPSHTDHLDSALAHWLSKKQYGGKPVVIKRDLKLR